MESKCKRKEESGRQAASNLSIQNLRSFYGVWVIIGKILVFTSLRSSLSASFMSFVIFLLGTHGTNASPQDTGDKARSKTTIQLSATE